MNLRAHIGPGAALLICVFCLPAISPAQNPRNSTKKDRVKKNSLTARAGTAIEWKDSVEDALAESKASGKPVFWYVPTLRGTFMDRKPVIDHYMMAGPFSWPGIIKLINEHFVPVKSVPPRRLAQKYELVPYKFVEPGFLVLDSEGTELVREHKITTFHHQWFVNRLAKPLAEDPGIERSFARQSLTDAYASLIAGDYEAAVPFSEDGDAGSADERIQKGWISGMAAFRSGDHDRAAEIWTAAAATDPGHPLAWKLSSEAQGIGPFVRGFEIIEPIPGPAVTGVSLKGGSGAPEGVFTSAECWQRSLQYLLRMQDESGKWWDSDYDFGGSDSLPNVHVAVSSLCVLALLEGVDRLPEDSKDRATMEDAIQRGAQYVLNDDEINRDDSDEILWAYAFRTRVAAKMLSRTDPDDEQAVTAGLAVLQNCATQLEEIRSPRGGGWYHEYRNPFVTATALCALRHAADAGATVNLDVIAKGTAALTFDRFDNGAYPYGSRRENGPGGEEEISASAGRAPLCELSLMMWDKSDQAALQRALDRSMRFHEDLDAALKYDNHTDNQGYGGFFFWYDMRGRSEAISRLEPSPEKQALAARQMELILQLPEIDGCFVDSHELGRCYGTAMAILSMSLLEQRQ